MSGRWWERGSSSRSDGRNDWRDSGQRDSPRDDRPRDYGDGWAKNAYFRTKNNLEEEKERTKELERQLKAKEDEMAKRAAEEKEAATEKKLIDKIENTMAGAMERLRGMMPSRAKAEVGTADAEEEKEATTKKAATPALTTRLMRQLRKQDSNASDKSDDSVAKYKKKKFADFYEAWNKFMRKDKNKQKPTKDKSRSRSRPSRRRSRSRTRSRTRSRRRRDPSRRRSRSRTPSRSSTMVKAAASSHKVEYAAASSAPKKKMVKSKAASSNSRPLPTTDGEDGDDDEEEVDEEAEEEPSPSLDVEDDDKLNVEKTATKRIEIILKAIGLHKEPITNKRDLKRRPGWPKWCELFAKSKSIKWSAVNARLRKNGHAKVRMAKGEKIRCLLTKKELKV
eukprot:TRINITY_DN34180_c0_g1_i6.p1 TRINITY_DN34180_c0_g1~~TRINITY_DN34180_c0_g1_i6.p1  ORF type:complete len:394 (-),score=121.78 TRINITY_DN34180_c0_g1_i6:785-1966(-)